MSKKNIILGGVLIVLLAAAYLYNGPWQDWKSRSKKIENFLTALEYENTDKIEMSGKINTTLEKTGDKWKFAGTKELYAKQSAVDGALNALKESSKADLELASKIKEKKSDFNTDESGTYLTLYSQGNKLQTIVVGKRTNDFSGNYISLPDRDETYKTNASLSLFEDIENFYDKQIFSLSKDKITKVRFQYPGREFIIEKKDGVWKGVKPYAFNTDNEKVEDILGSISNLSADNIPEQKFEGTGLEKNLIIVQVSGEEIDSTIMIGDKDPESSAYFAKKGDTDNIYLVNGTVKDTLDIGIADLR